MKEQFTKDHVWNHANLRFVGMYCMTDEFRNARTGEEALHALLDRLNEEYVRTSDEFYKETFDALAEWFTVTEYAPVVVEDTPILDEITRNQQYNLEQYKNELIYYTAIGEEVSRRG